MAAISNATTSAIVTDAVLAEKINAIVRWAVQTPFIFQGIAEVSKLEGTTVLSTPIWGNIAAAPAYSTETDEVASVAVTPTAANITTAEYATGTFLSERAEMLSQHPALAQCIEAVVKGLMLRVDTAVLALATSISGSQGSNATTNDLGNFVSAMAAFTAQGKFATYMPACVMHPDAVRDLNADLATSASALLGSTVGASMQSALQGVNQGVFTNFCGYMMAQSDRVPAGDTTGWSNFMVHVGPNESAFGVPFLKEIQIKFGPRPERVGQYIIGSMDVGAGVLEQARAYKFITKT